MRRASRVQQTLPIEWFGPEPPPAIPGLAYVPDWLGAGEEQRLLDLVDALPWRRDWKRRIQVYGVGYGDGETTVEPPLPPPLAALGRRLRAEGWLEAEPANAVVNEYLPGQGIGAHRDYAVFGSVASVSLGCWCLIELRHASTGARFDAPLAPRSMLRLAGAARWHWSHAIAARRSDVIAGVRVPRGRRVSVTFRTLLPAGGHTPSR